MTRTRPTFPDRALLSAKVLPTASSSGASSPRSPRSPLSPRFRNGTRSEQQSHKEENAVELPELCHSPRLQQHEQEEEQEELEEQQQSQAQIRGEEDDDDVITEVSRLEQEDHVAQEIEPAPEEVYEQTGKYSTISSTIKGDGLWPRFQRMWIGHVSIRVASSQRRNHLALERGFLSYMRTSLALSMTGIMIAQLLRLEESATSGPSRAVGGVALAAAFICASIVTILTGAIRFWRQQVAMAAGKCWAGGPELLFVWASFVALSIAMFVILLVQPDPDT